MSTDKEKNWYTEIIGHKKLENSFVNDLNITSHGVLVLPKVRELYAGASSTFIAGWSLQGAG